MLLGLRYFGSERLRSPMTGEGKAIFRLRKDKVTYDGK